MGRTRDDAEQLGYAHGSDGIANHNPYIPADEWNHSGEMHQSYERGYANGKTTIVSAHTKFIPVAGEPIWCKGLGFEGWAIVQRVYPDSLEVVSANDGNLLHFLTNDYWPQKPPLPQFEEKFVDDAGDEVTVGYGDYADLDDTSKFDRLFYMSSGNEEITISLNDVTPLLEAIKKVSRQ